MNKLEQYQELKQIINVDVTPVEELHPVLAKEVLAKLRKYNYEELVLALLLKAMIRQTDKTTQNNPKLQQILKHLSKVTHAAAYIRNAVDAANKIWYESFTELKCNISIFDFIKTFVIKYPKQFKKMGLNTKKIIALRKDHADKNYAFVTLKLTNLMIKKLDLEIEQDTIEVAKYHATKEK